MLIVSGVWVRYNCANFTPPARGQTRADNSMKAHPAIRARSWKDGGVSCAGGKLNGIQPKES